MLNTSKYHQGKDELERERKFINAAKKDPKHFEFLYNKYYEQIFHFIYQRMDDKEGAFDCASQVFLKALTNLHKYEFRGLPFSSWLYRIAYSEINQFFKDRKAERTVNIDSTNLKEMVNELSQDSDNKDEKMEHLVASLRGLAEDDLNLIEMRYFEKRSFKEIGEILSITENNAKVKTYRVLEKMKKHKFEQTVK
ncbi:MAG: sigma-70 family RNA polymerase sigma factor [Flavobacteriales bacterium]|nr:sigma-70 family RNA polymerase sigma factor [Flavobacteriales bacterium]